MHVKSQRQAFIKSQRQAFVSELSVLVVDDDPSTLLIADTILRSMGVANVECVYSGSEAFRRLVAGPTVDCILCDIHMLDGNGFQLLRSVRLGEVRGVRPDTCFILMSGMTVPDYVQAAAKLDANGYLAKPFTRESLQNAVTKGRFRPIPVNFAKYASILPHMIGSLAVTSLAPVRA